MIESLLSNKTSNQYKFIMTPTPEKYLWPLSKKWSDDSTFTKIKDYRQHALVTYAR